MKENNVTEKIAKYIFGIGIIMVLLACFFPKIIHAESMSKNLFKNGSFEAPTYSEGAYTSPSEHDSEIVHIQTGSATINTDMNYVTDGTQSIRLENEGGMAINQLVSVKAGMKYIFSADLHLANAESNNRFQLSLYENGSFKGSWNSGDFTAADGWKRVSFTMTAATDCDARLKIEFLKAGAAYIDNISVVEVSPFSFSGNRFRNGSFEAPAYSSGNYTSSTDIGSKVVNIQTGKATINTDMNYVTDGAQSIRLENEGGMAINQLVPVKAGMKYVFSADLLLANTESNNRFQLSLYENGSFKGSWNSGDFTAADGWKRVSFAMTATTDCNARLKIEFLKAGAAYIDNISVVEVPTAVSGEINDESSEVVKNEMFSVQLKHGSGTIIAAQYDEKGKLIEITLGENNISATANQAASKIKLMLFKDMSSIVPLCESRELKVVDPLVETVVIDENFDGKDIGDFSVTGDNASIQEGALCLGDSTSYVTSFENQTQYGTISFDLQYKYSSGWTSIYFGNAINLYLDSGNLGSHLGGTSLLGYYKLDKEKTYKVVIDYDVICGKYDVMLDGELIGAGVNFRNAETFDNLKVAVPTGTSVVIDNFKITSRNKDIKNSIDNATTPATADTCIGMNGDSVISGYNNYVTVTRDNGLSEKLAFFKFVAPEVPEGKRAYLNLWLDSATYASSSEMFTVYATETNWTEDLASSDEPIKLIDTVGKRIFQNDAEKQWIKIDITDYVKKNSGKEISLSLRGDSLSGSSTLNFESRENACKPNIFVCDALTEIPSELTKPVATEVSFRNIANTSAAIMGKEELNMYVLGNTYADMTKNSDIYGDFAHRISDRFGVKINYINKGMSELAAQDAVDMASKLVEDQTPDLMVIDFEGISAKTASAIVEKYRGINRYCEFIFVTDKQDISGEGVMALTRERLIGAMPIDITSSAKKEYVTSANIKSMIEDKDENLIVDCYSMDDGFESKFVYENQKQYFTIEDDALIGGKYLHVKKDTSRGYAGGEYFLTPLGGDVRIDFQLCAFSPDTLMEMFLYAEGRQTTMTQLVLENGILSAGSNREKIAAIECNKWYNIAILYDLHNSKYDVFLNGKPALRDVVGATGTGTLRSLRIQIDNGNTGDFAIDSIRTSYYTEKERMLGNVTDVPSDDTPKVLLENNFNNRTPGLALQDIAGTISYVNENGNIFARADRTKEDGSCSTVYSFKETKCNISLDLDFRLNDWSYATKLIYILSDNGSAVPIYFNEGTLKLNDSAYTAPTMSKLSADEWHHLKVVTDLANQKYFIYIDGSLIGLQDGYEFLNRTVSKFTGFRFAISAGNSTYDIDNIKVQTLGGEVDTSNIPKKTLPGYDPINVDAPENNAWLEKFRRNPSGEIYEAEDMQLYNYEQYTDSNFHNNSGIKVSETGAGTATFTYNGTTGYKRIDIGYLEAVGANDSHFYLYQNGDLIDWFVCQNDQTGRYSRTSKEHWYVKNGDVFTIRGTYGEEPSMLDYVEFTDGEKATFKFGTVAAGLNKATGYRLQSSWDADGAGGWASSGLTMRDSLTNESVTLERRLADFYSDFTVEYVYTPYAYSKYNALVGYSDGENVKYPIDVRFEGSSIIVGGTEYKDVLKKNGSSNLRFAVNTKSKNYTVIADSVVVAKNVPFACNVSTFNIFRFVSDKEGTAYFKAHPFLLEAGYLLKENFFCESKKGVELYNWDVKGKTNMISDDTDIYDPYHRSLTPGAEMKKSISPQGGVITYETQILFPQKKDGARVAIGCSSGTEIALYTSNGNICYDDGKGGSGVVWENYKPNVWYEYKLEVNIKAHTCKFYVNSFKSVEAPITSSMLWIDYVKLSSGSEAGDVWVDDIAVFKGTYLDDNEVPEIEVPEGYGDYNVILQTCDMWREGEHFGYDYLNPWAARTPFLGYYEDGNPEVADWQTKYLVEHGINVFAPCWYAVDAKSAPKNPRNGYALDQGFMNSKYQDKIQFSICLTYAGVTEGEENFLKYFVNYWIEHYFKHPSYFKVDNKPVIMCFNVQEFADAFGTNYASVLNKVDEMLREEGFGGAIFVGDASAASKSCGWDYTYSYTFGSVNDGYQNIMNIKNYAAKSDSAWYIPTVTQGWGNEPWGRADRKVNMPVKDWKACLEWIKNVYMPEYTNDPLLKNTLSLDNWNEYCEGHSIAPSNLAGFGYLDAVRDVFTKADKEHTDIIPTKRFDQMSAILW